MVTWLAKHMHSFIREEKYGSVIALYKTSVFTIIYVCTPVASLGSLTMHSMHHESHETGQEQVEYGVCQAKHSICEEG